MAGWNIWGGMNGAQRTLSILMIVVLVGGLAAGGYEVSDGNNGVKCLSCLALVPSLSGAWSDSPLDHPNEVMSDLDSGKIALLFFWQPSCGACDKQWEDMKDYGLVTGTEQQGRMAKYDSEVELHSVNARDDPYTDWFREYASAFPEDDWATPMTSIVFKDGSSIYWFSEIGYEEGKKMTPEDIESLLNEAMNK